MKKMEPSYQRSMVMSMDYLNNQFVQILNPI